MIEEDIQEIKTRLRLVDFNIQQLLDHIIPDKADTKDLSTKVEKRLQTKGE